MNDVLPTIGPSTPDERQLTSYLMDGLAHFASQRPIERRTLIAAMSDICKIVFTVETPLSIKEQCEEIDAFAAWLKNHALKNAVRS